MVKNMNDKGMLLPEDLIAYILREVTQGLVYLHKEHVMHRDIKGQNVLLTRQAHIRLVDFGKHLFPLNCCDDHVMNRSVCYGGTDHWLSTHINWNSLLDGTRGTDSCIMQC